MSYQFVSRSIETWFDVELEGAWEAGLNLGRSTLDTLTHELGRAKTPSWRLNAWCRQRRYDLTLAPKLP